MNHTRAPAFPSANAIRAALALVLALFLGIAVGQPSAAAAGGPSAPSATNAKIPSALVPAPGTLAGLTKAGLVGAGEPVSAFSWTLEVKRPMRDPRLVSERFLGSPGGEYSGLSPMMRHYGPEVPALDSGIAPVLNVRGLTNLRPGEEKPDVEIDGLRLPLVEGAVFRLAWSDDGATLSQSCTVGARESAASLHPAMPGDLRRIACEGDGRYKGIPVGVNAEVLYLERLGVFLQASSTLRTPLGPLRAQTRIVEFSMSPP